MLCLCIVVFGLTMSDQIKSSRHERRVGFHSQAPFAKHDYKFNRRLDIRLAGQVWSESPAERSKRLTRKRKQDSSKVNPVWFEETGVAGPDENYNTREFITYKYALSN